MKPEKLQELLNLGEGPRVEYKANLRSIDAIGREVCGFLNTTGGYVVCGLGKQGAVTGVVLAPGELADFERQLHEGLAPKTLVSVFSQPLLEKTVVVIEVPKGADIPYSFRNIIYLRGEDSSEAADAGTIRDMVLRAQIEPERWERRFSLADLEKEVDGAQIASTVNDAEKVKRAYFQDKENPVRVLEDLSAARYGRLTNGGDVLFASNPAIRYPQVRVRAMRYNTDKTGDTFGDMKSLEGPLHAIFEEAYSFIVRNTASISRFRQGNPQREDAPIYPEAAVREALINALAHRDYTAPSGGVLIHVYPRRLEIWNSGAFLNGVTSETIASGQISVLRNPDIAHVLYLRGLMEKTGRGGRLIVDQCLAAGLPRPVWASENASGVTITFFTTQDAMEVTTQATMEVATQVTMEVQSLIRHLIGTMGRQQLQDALKLKNVEHFRKAYILPALAAGVIEMTLPDKPKSSKQRYRLTALGKAVRAISNPEIRG